MATYEDYAVGPENPSVFAFYCWLSCHAAAAVAVLTETYSRWSYGSL
jgi:hypothetical protein